jgi:pimeloyl-ACP methyl ester carboxylesterase
MFKLLTGEAQAYLKMGILAPGRKRILQSSHTKAKTGVLFVPGVGANGSQFLKLKKVLEPHAQWFGSFESFSLRHPEKVARDLEEYLASISPKADKLVLIGHSLGGLLLRMALQSDRVPDNVAGWVSICAPLHGTWRSKLAPTRSLRALSPDGPLIEEVLRNNHRLARLEGRILTIGARRDQMIQPYTSAFLEGYEQLELQNVAHAGSLFDAQVLSEVKRLVQTWTR